MKLLVDLDRPQETVTAGRSMGLRITRPVKWTFGMHALLDDGGVAMGEAGHCRWVHADVMEGEHR